ncbi:ATP-dependent bile acid permease [Patellaria atrata CBS 101060]|uniref:ATP-dependent bile acid permease n=1 Tax=Patellaria atrata CBS 101060 TaxID=1346257 RepID=A0A9P4VQK5_9PEZI|nr:ATP-dependent bile acid permease [Patellaria atrata CBS 101060]
MAALISVIVILNMPLRHPSLSRAEISATFDAPTFELRSPEDSLTPWQFMSVSWMAPLIGIGALRQLHDEDVWKLGYEFQHRRLHHAFRELQGSVVRRLIKANGIDLLIISALAIVELAANLAVPVTLQQLLRSMERPEVPKRAALIYASFSLIARLISSQAAVFGVWYSRRAYERSRGEMITMLYEKTLSRKIIGDKLKQPDHADERPISSNTANIRDRSRFHPLVMWKQFSTLIKKALPSHTSSQTEEDSKQPASMGKILNLMRNDVYEIAQRFWDFQMLTSKPLGLIFSVLLIWRLLGWSCLVGILTVMVAQVLNALIVRILLRWEVVRRRATDGKLKVTSQFVEAIRHLRWYGWQDAWLKHILEARQHELNIRIITAAWNIMITFSNAFGSTLFPLVAFYAYTAWAGQTLGVDIAFPALQLFSMLESNLREIPNLITVLLNASIAVGRLESFMNEPDKDNSTMRHTNATELALENASFAWPGANEFVLKYLNLSFPPGLTVVCGKVAAGKSALLQALLGELDLKEGTLVRPDEMIGYCAQMPWLQSMSIRENILFSAQYDEVRYKEVLEACALMPDMANLQNGDLSNIGENGVGLSGGQRARVALARAVYSRAKILLLDDPISALDHQTAEFIVKRCIAGRLLEGRTVILATHRTELCHGIATQIVEITDGQANILDPETTSLQDLQSVTSQEHIQQLHTQDHDEMEAAIPDKFIEDEHRSHGGVQASIYWEYVKAGKLRWWALLILTIVLYRASSTGENWFLKYWGEAYGESDRQETISNPLKRLPPPEDNVKPWLWWYFFIVISEATTWVVAQIFMAVIVYSAGRQMFKDVMQRVSHATFRFYDVTPVGRLMNRLTSDISTIDGNISQKFYNVARHSVTLIFSVVVIASVTPSFLVFSFSLAAGFIYIFQRFLPTSQSLRRLEMVSLSPLMSNFGALVEGLTTVRAFCTQSRFQDRVIEVTDAFQKMDHFYWSLQAWLMYRFDALSATSTFVLTCLALYIGISPGLTAFVLIAASKFVNATHSLCRQYGQLQMDFVSVERVVELLHLEQEPPGDVTPPAWWPSQNGDIVFEDVTIKYAPTLEPALSNVSLTLKAGRNTAIVGRTGSGKSTFALSLLATITPTSGRILIDGIDISTVDKQILRQRITFLAQDPILFPGTLHTNLDPLSLYPAPLLSQVLALVAHPSYNWTLDTPIEASGRNLSQGQRQLVGLARALLRKSSIVILDEATASIDRKTAERVQRVLREELGGATVVTIAHRVEAVRGAEGSVVLSGGRVIRAEGSAEGSVE